MNKPAKLTLLTFLLTGGQAVMNHCFTSCFAHSYFTIYLYVELTLVALVLLTGLRSRASVWVFFAIIAFESIWFLINEKPYAPDQLLMILGGIIRIYILSLLFKRKEKK
ncbi:MAG: hypothetical protein V4613_08090 [Bacteroidota bacterium]